MKQMFIWQWVSFCQLSAKDAFQVITAGLQIPVDGMSRRTSTIIAQQLWSCYQKIWYGEEDLIGSGVLQAALMHIAILLVFCVLPVT